MKVILQDKVEHLGNTGDIVRVRDGFGRNFLLPRGLAVLADEGNVKNLEHQKRVVAARAAKMQKEAQELAAKISANPNATPSPINAEMIRFRSSSKCSRKLIRSIPSSSSSSSSSEGGGVLLPPLPPVEATTGAIAGVVSNDVLGGSAPYDCPEYGSS